MVEAPGKTDKRDDAAANRRIELLSRIRITLRIEHHSGRFEGDRTERDQGQDGSSLPLGIVQPFVLYLVSEPLPQHSYPTSSRAIC